MVLTGEKLDGLPHVAYVCMKVNMYSRSFTNKKKKVGSPALNNLGLCKLEMVVSVICRAGIFVLEGNGLHCEERDHTLIVERTGGTCE